MRTPRTPIEALSAATRTDIARIGRCADGTVEPLPHRSEFAVLGFFEPRHKAAKTRSCGRESLDWGSRCPHCGAFDALSWRTPAWAVPGSNLPVADEQRTAPELASSLPELSVAPPAGLASTLERAKTIRSARPGSSAVEQPLRKR